MATRPKLNAVQLEALFADLTERRRLREIMAEHSYPVLELEFGITHGTIMRMERQDLPGNRYRKHSIEVIREVKRRRRLYWTVKECYDPRYSDRALLAKYDISKPTLLKHMQAFKQMRLEELRRAA